MSSDDSPLTVAIASTFVANPIEPALAFWFDELNIRAHIKFAPYNQPFQQLLDHSSLLSSNRRGINIMLVRLQDWRRRDEHNSPETIGWRIDLKQKVSDFVAAITSAASRLAVPQLVVLCPGSEMADQDVASSEFVSKMEESLGTALTAVPGVEFISGKQIVDAYGTHQYDQPDGDKLAQIPYTPLFFTALASVIARSVYGYTQADYKVVAVDCDQVLWTGICGEDGAMGVEINSARQAIQEFLVRLHAKGVLICLCSRNNEADVLDVFHRRPEMRLKIDHVVATKLNWKPKSENIKELARELNLAPDAFVFLDDDRVECAEVQANCPEALSIQLPSRTDAIPDFLRNLWVFRGSDTNEARRRTAFYQANAARGRVLQSAPSLGEFLERLDLKVQITDLAARHLSRASELTQRTNQFNATSLKRSEAEIDALLRQGASAFVANVSDRFGDYGHVGLVIYSETTDALVIDTFLLSCRALGRGVEHRMLAKLGNIATERGLSRIDCPFISNGRNQPILNFLNSTAGRYQESQTLGVVFRIPSIVATQIRYDPEVVMQADLQSSADSAVDTRQVVNEQFSCSRDAASAVDTRGKATLLVSIAGELSDVQKIHALVCARQQIAMDRTQPYLAPRTPVEQQIAAILAEVLGVDRVGVMDNFFEIGGHSLLAMQVLFRIRESFQIEFSVRLMYAGAFTAAELARKVVELQLRGADAPKMDTLIERVATLSDEEVKSMLARRTGPSV